MSFGFSEEPSSCAYSMRIAFQRGGQFLVKKKVANWVYECEVTGRGSLMRIMRLSLLTWRGVVWH